MPAPPRLALPIWPPIGIEVLGAVARSMTTSRRGSRSRMLSAPLGIPAAHPFLARASASSSVAPTDTRGTTRAAPPAPRTGPGFAEAIGMLMPATVSWRAMLICAGGWFERSMRCIPKSFDELPVGCGPSEMDDGLRGVRPAPGATGASISPLAACFIRYFCRCDLMFALVRSLTPMWSRIAIGFAWSMPSDSTAASNRECRSSVQMHLRFEPPSPSSSVFGGDPIAAAPA
mmetsp:Transcript_14998/g.30132  ORF Transcript_14998/g.30132 Transcript_14998/m.30132 type:complete len:231 (+) Transcript_14998:401-1093(+)